MPRRQPQDSHQPRMHDTWLILLIFYRVSNETLVRSENPLWREGTTEMNGGRIFLRRPAVANEAAIARSKLAAKTRMPMASRLLP